MRSKLSIAVATGLLAATLSGVAASATVIIDPLTRQPITYDENRIRSGASPVKREVVDFTGKHRPGTIIVNTTERRLYLVMEGGKALKYGIGVGREGFQWGGTHRVSQKREWPGWTPPPQMLKRQPDLPRHMPGGPANPLGARALYLGSTLFRIHGSNEPWTIGQAVSSGCFRMTNDDVTDLYERVNVGAQVVVMR